MNERIRELTEQAWECTRDEQGIFVKGNFVRGHFINDDGTVNWDFLHAYDKKFAELIINECAETIQDLVDQRVPASEYPSRLKRYYGVENE